MNRWVSYAAAAAATFAVSPACATVTISTSPTQNMNCVSGVCTPTAANAVLSITDLTNMLASENVQVNTGSGSLAQQVLDIVISSGFSWTSSKWLTLTAYRNVTFNQPVVAAGRTFVTLTTAAGTYSGILSFGAGGSLTFYDTTSALEINNQAYTLENSISTLAAAIAANPTGVYALANAYDASKDGTYASSPIATDFTGKFEGLGNTISNLTINNPYYGQLVGLSAEADSPGKISDLVMNNANITGANTGGNTGEAVGILAGASSAFVNQTYVSGTVVGGNGAYVGGFEGVVAHNPKQNPSSVTNSSFSGKVTGGTAAFVGGFAGSNNNEGIQNCWSAGTVSAKPGSQVGGLLGEDFGSVQSSHSSATVKALGHGGNDTDAGGLVGLESGYLVSDHASGSVTIGDHAFAGGLVGYNLDVQIVSSYATGNVTGTEHSALGGLVGIGQGSVSGSFATGGVVGGIGSTVGGFVATGPEVFNNDYALGAVKGGSQTGGFAGNSDNAIGTSYSIGKVSGSGQAGGFIGVATGTYTDAYWDTTTSGKTQGTGSGNVTGINPLSDSQLKSGLPSGFDSSIWTQSANINNGYPYLIANPPAK